MSFFLVGNCVGLIIITRYVLMHQPSVPKSNATTLSQYAHNFESTMLYDGQCSLIDGRRKRLR